MSNDNKTIEHFKRMTPELRTANLHNYNTLITAIENKRPYAMPHMEKHWRAGRLILQRIVRDTDAICTFNKPDCPYLRNSHSVCMINKFEKEVREKGPGHCENEPII